MAFRRSSYTFEEGNCVEIEGAVTATGRVVRVRDSKDPDGGVLTFTPEAFAAFRRRVTAGKPDCAAMLRAVA